MVGRGIALLFHNRDTRRGWVVSSTPRTHFTPGKDPTPIVKKARQCINRLNIMGRDSSASIAVCYGLKSPGIESRRERDFSHMSRPTRGPTQSPVSWVPGSFQEVKGPGSGVGHPPPFIAEVQERVELYLCSPSGPSWSWNGWKSSSDF